MEHGREFSSAKGTRIMQKPVVKYTETSMKLLRGFTGEQSCRVLSGHRVCRPASTVLASQKYFLVEWLSFFCAVVIVRLFQYVTALRVVTYILNVLTPDL